MFKNNFFRRVCITQFLLVVLSCILSNYIVFIANNLGFVMALIFLIPYEFIYSKDFKEYMEGRK